MTAAHTITELYTNKAESLIDILIPLLKGKVSVTEETKEPHLSAALLKESAHTKTLYYLLGKKAVALSFPDTDPERHSVSAVDFVNRIYNNQNSI